MQESLRGAPSIGQPDAEGLACSCKSYIVSVLEPIL